MTAALVAADVDDPRGMRQGDADWLSLALIDSRNRSLRWLSAFEAFGEHDPHHLFDPPAWSIGRCGWFQEYWIARHVQRQRGALADPAALRLASIEPRADEWFAPRQAGTARERERRWAQVSALGESLRDYLASTLELTLELLEKAGRDDAGLYFFRLALLHEDRLAETLAQTARALGLGHPEVVALVPALPTQGRRDPIGLAAQRVSVGTAEGGFAPDNERPAWEDRVLDFDIDAQPVCWAQFAEFVADCGYDERRWWSPEGWDWVEARVRRAPRYVEQFSGAVLVQMHGKLARAPAGQSVMHVSAHEADAWCRWAGRRLPTEAEWVLALRQAGARGFRWGDGFEWMAGPARPWAGQGQGPGALDAEPVGEPGARVLRGASWLTVPRQRHPGARRFALAGQDELFSTFRSCSA